MCERDLDTTYVPMPAVCVGCEPVRSRLWYASAILLTLIVVVLVIGGAVQHPIYFEDVDIAVAAMELVPSAVEAQDELAGPVLSPWGCARVFVRGGVPSWGSRCLHGGRTEEEGIFME